MLSSVIQNLQSQVPAAPAAPSPALPTPGATPTPASGNLPTRNNNPGDIRDSNGNFIHFSTPQEGYAALLNDLQAKINGRTKTGLNGSSTLADFANKYDPAGDGGNNPASYAANLANKLGVSPATTLSQLQGRIGDLADAVSSNEGFNGAQAKPSAPPAPNVPGIGVLPAAAPTNLPPVTSQDQAPQQSGGWLNNIENFGLGVAKSIPQTIAGGAGMIKSALDQTAGRVGNAISGKGFTPTGQDAQSQANSQAVSDKLNIPDITTPQNTAQKVGDVAGQIGQFFIDPENGVEEAVSDLPKGVQLLLEGLAKAPQNVALAKAQGQSNGSAMGVGALSAAAPAIGESLSGAKGLLQDLLGGQGSADAFKVKSAAPDLVNAWKNGTQSAANLADTIGSAAKSYTSEGIAKLQAVKDALPDVAMPQSNIIGGLRSLIEDGVSGKNVTPEAERTIANLQSLLEKNVGNSTTSKGLLDLKTAVDQGGFYQDDPTGAHNVSNKVVQNVRNFLTDTATDRMSVLDAQNGTSYAKQIKSALADATDRQNFMDKLKANVLGKNPDKYVEQGTSKVRQLIAKFGDPAQLENTKSLLSEFEQRIGKPGLFTKDIEAANAAGNLKGVGGRITKKALLYGGAGAVLGSGATGLLHDILSHV